MVKIFIRMQWWKIKVTGVFGCRVTWLRVFQENESDSRVVWSCSACLGTNTRTWRHTGCRHHVDWPASNVRFRRRRRYIRPYAPHLAGQARSNVPSVCNDITTELERFRFWTVRPSTWAVWTVSLSSAYHRCGWPGRMIQCRHYGHSRQVSTGKDHHGEGTQSSAMDRREGPNIPTLCSSSWTQVYEG